MSRKLSVFASFACAPQLLPFFIALLGSAGVHSVTAQSALAQLENWLKFKNVPKYRQEKALMSAL